MKARGVKSVDLMQAIADLEGRRGKKFGSGDRKVIASVVVDLGVSDFEIRASEDVVRDTGDVIHIHPTMIVARRPFEGSTDRGPEPYPNHRHFRKLDGWVDASQKGKSANFSGEVSCPKCFLVVPRGSECFDGALH